MSQRIITFFIALFIIVNIVANLFSSETTQFAASKFAYAVDYYQDRAKYYYGRFTGKIPSDYVVQHYREWRNFAKISDALVLDLKRAEDIFHIYNDTRLNVFSKLKTERIERREKIDPQKNTDNKRPPFFRRRDFGRLEREFKTEFINAIEGMLSPNEIAVVSDVLDTFRSEPSAELRGLRYVQLSEKQRETLVPYAFEFVKAQRSFSRSFGPMHARWSPPSNESPKQELTKFQTERERIDREYNQAKETFLAKVEETLTLSQKKEWNDGQKRASAEIQDRTVRMVTERPDSREKRGSVTKGENADRLSTESS